MKKIISFSLWGSKPIYTIGAIENVKLQKSIYPDWICRFYVSKVSSNITDQLVEMGSEVIQMDNNYPTWANAPLWRFLPASEPDVDIMISRDTDSRLSMREKCAVDEWLSSDKNFHLIRDHPWHGEVIMAGMWGVRNHILNDMEILINNFSSHNYKENDQRFLREIIYPVIKDDCFVHDEFRSCIGKFLSLRQEITHNIKHERINYDFIGDVYDENGNPDMVLCDVIKRKLSE